MPAVAAVRMASWRFWAVAVVRDEEFEGTHLFIYDSNFGRNDDGQEQLAAG